MGVWDAWFIRLCRNNSESYEQKAEVNNQLITSAQSLFTYCRKRLVFHLAPVLFLMWRTWHLKQPVSVPGHTNVLLGKAVDQEKIGCHICNEQVHYHVYRLLLDHIFSKMYPFHILPSCSFKIYFNRILTHVYVSAKWCLLWKFSN